MPKEITSIRDLVPDSKNPNKGTARGQAMLETSVRRYGAGRSVLADKNGRVIAGNHVTEAAADAGMEDVIVVQSDGTKLVVVQRTDLDMETDPAAHALAVADNRTSQVNLAWDAEILAALEREKVPVGDFFRPQEFDKLQEPGAADIAHDDEIPDMELEPFEEYDYVMCVFRNSQDWQRVCDLLGLDRVQWKRAGTRKVGFGRVVDGKRIIELAESKAEQK